MGILYVKFFLFPSKFQTGTCAMKPHKQGRVVDEMLNVYGVQNLKIAGIYPATLKKLDTYLNPFFSDCSIAHGVLIHSSIDNHFYLCKH